MFRKRRRSHHLVHILIFFHAHPLRNLNLSSGTPLPTYTHVHLSQLMMVIDTLHMYIWVSLWWSTYTHAHLSQLMMVIYTIHMYIWVSLWWSTYTHVHLSQLMMVIYTIHMYIWVSLWWSIYTHVHLSQLMMVLLYTCTFQPVHDGPSIHMYIWVSSWSGLENSTRPLVFTSAWGCRASGNFDISSENYFFPIYANNFCDAGQAILRYFEAWWWSSIHMYIWASKFRYYR